MEYLSSKGNEKPTQEREFFKGMSSSEQFPRASFLPQNSHFSQVSLPKFQGQGHPTPQNSHFSQAFLPKFQGQGEGEEEEASNSTREARAGFGMKNSPKKDGIKLGIFAPSIPKRTLWSSRKFFFPLKIPRMMGKGAFCALPRRWPGRDRCHPLPWE